ncbi:hypothetical protein [Vibrio cyclitrophicus]|uniref:hypothetical protein n=1 Tax=Vibrio cyclitrophicus TaxID=47951 RepID=UPI0007EED6E1|nr:hypothetical protein [Vibrio cyclitrophicus]OBT07570.1 hypothetical protein A9265_14260 [Vibrio cyclitrophicus]
MEYSAVFLCPSGGIVRHEETQQVANVKVGDFESMDDAVNQACLTLECSHLHKGVISKGGGKSGFMVITNQELDEI